MVEHRICNASVVGSNPTRGSKTYLSMNTEILNTTEILFQSGQIIDKAQCEIYLCEWDNIHGDIVLFV